MNEPPSGGFFVDASLRRIASLLMLHGPAAEEEREAWELRRGRRAIATNLRLSDLLIRGKMVTAEAIERAMERQARYPGRLTDCLVATGGISREKLETFLERIPKEPVRLADAGVDAAVLMGLLMKLIYAQRLETEREFADAIKLPYPIVTDLVRMAVDRKLLMSLGARGEGSLNELTYMMSEEGRRWTLDLLNRSGYIGPAPVTLEEFTRQVSRQKLSNETITFERIRASTRTMTLEDTMIEQCGPAINSGRAILLYGAAGNGKTSLARCLADVFEDVIFMPYAVSVEGQIIRIFDPSMHCVIEPAEVRDENPGSVVRRQAFDARWAACRRPFVTAGGELTLDMLDLRYDTGGHFYEAPLHVKALCGCFIIDDFGHQMILPANLLNRWIVPLENRVDYLKLHTGKTFTIPFEEIIIFSTNLEPRDLMDPAFLRRLPYKIEVGGPTVEAFRAILEKECERAGLELPREAFEAIVYQIRQKKGLELAAFQPRFIVDQVTATCRFMQQPPHFEPRFLLYALDNLSVNESPMRVEKAA